MGMYDFLDKIGLKAVLEAVKGKIPTSLPANGGDADTVDGMHADNFIYPRGYFNSIDLDDIKYPCSGLALNCIHSPSSVWGTLLVYAGGTGSFTQIYTPTANKDIPTAMYFRHYGDAGWTAWHNTAEPIKKMTFSSVATNAAGGGVLFSADFGTPITIACTSRADTQCTPFFAANQWLVLAKDCATLNPIPAGTYSFDVWYI